MEAAYITAFLAIPRIDVKEKVEFLVDTRATKTRILDRDATAPGIPYMGLSRQKQPVRSSRRAPFSNDVRFFPEGLNWALSGRVSRAIEFEVAQSLAFVNFED